MITIETTFTSPALDDSLLLIKQYLTDRLAESSTKSLVTNESDITIDLGVLGSNMEEKKSESWQHKTIRYALQLDRSSVILGPLYRPMKGEGPCLVCLERRWATNCFCEEPLLEVLQRVLLFGRSPWQTPFVLEMIWLVLASTLCQRSMFISTEEKNGQFYTLSLETFRLARYRLIPDPHCPICALRKQDSPEFAHIQLSPRMKLNAVDSRLVEASAYELPMAGYINPVCGMLGGEVSSNYSHVISLSVRGNLAVENDTGKKYKCSWGGHGNTYDASLRAAILEALERDAGMLPRMKETRVFDCYENLRSEALNPQECGLHPRDYYGRVDKNYIMSFSSTLKTPWVWGYSFRLARPILVPEQLVYYAMYRTEYRTFVQESSNGCAVGSCLEEAILYGLLELIERDSFLLTWYARVAPRRIDPWSCHSQRLLHLLDRCDRLGYDVYILDTRYDIKIPSVAVILVLRENKLGKLAVGAKAGFDPESAICAALNEVGCAAPSIASRLRTAEDEVRAKARHYSKIVTVQDHGLVYGLPEMAAKACFLYQNPCLSSLEECYATWQGERPHNCDLRDDLLYCLDLILNLGMDVIVVEQTSPEQERIGLKSVRVIVPGLLPISFGGNKERIVDLPRLRTAPHVAGYLETDFNPALCNPDPHSFM